MHAMEGSWGLPEAETFRCIACCLGNRGKEDRGTVQGCDLGELPKELTISSPSKHRASGQKLLRSGHVSYYENWRISSRNLN